MQNSLITFKDELAEIIGTPTFLRPFVCDGSPLLCQVFIVGFNPASLMEVDFWTFWDDENGFDRSAWFGKYQLERKSQPLRPGKTRRNAVSNSRRVMNWLIEEVNSVSCLETNIYSLPTEQAIDLNSNQKITAPFDFLMMKIKPSVVVAHGKDAWEYMRSTSYAGTLIKVPHFSRGWSRAAAWELGQDIKNKFE